MTKQVDGQLMLSAEGSHASLFLSPGCAEARQMTATSGLRCLELYKTSGPLGSLARTLLGSSQWRSRAVLLEWKAEQLTETQTQTIMKRYYHDKKTRCSSGYSRTLSEAATKSKHLLFRLVPLTPRTAGTESPLWHTPNTMDYLCLIGAPTDTMRKRSQKFAEGRAPDPAEIAGLYPTPTTKGLRSGSNGCKKLKEMETEGTITTEEKKAMASQSGRLNPTWVEWLMGFPLGWTDLDA